MLTKEELPECPVATTVALIGSKWKLLILRNLLMRPWRFNELRKNLEGISQKVLTDSLRSLEEDGIIIRTVFPEVPPRVEYSLSNLGESMRPFSMQWSPLEIIIKKLQFDLICKKCILLFSSSLDNRISNLSLFYTAKKLYKTMISNFTHR